MRRLMIALAVLALAPQPEALAGRAEPIGGLIAAARQDDRAEDALWRQITSWSWPAPRTYRNRRAGTEATGDLDGRSRALLGVELRDFRLQEAAARRVGRYAPLRALRSLRLALRGSDPRVRAQAALALGWARDPGASPFVLGLLMDPDPVVRARAAAALGVMDDRSAGSRLQFALRDADPRVVEAASQALGGLGDPAAVESLRIVTHGDAPRLRRAAWEALARLGDRGKTSILRGAFGDPAVRSGPGGEDFVIRLGRAAGSGADAAGLALLAEDAADPDPVLRRAAVAGLAAAANPLSTDALLRALADPDGRVRAQAATGLAAIGNPRAVDALALALERGAAREAGLDRAGPALVALADSRSRGLLARLARSPDPLVAVAALAALGKLGGNEGFGAIAAGLASPHPEVRAGAALALVDLLEVPMVRERAVECGAWGKAGILTDQDMARSPDPAVGCVLRKLIAGLRDRDSRVRVAATQALGQVGDGRAYGALHEAAKDADPAVADAARLALGEVGERLAAGPLGSAALRGSLAAARGLAALDRGDASVRMAALLRARDPSLRGQAAGALRERWKYGTGGLVGAAEAAAAGRLAGALLDPDHGVRIQAALALAEHPGGAPAAALRAALPKANPFARAWLAVALLRQSGSPDPTPATRGAWDALEQVAASPDPELRRTGAEALAWLRGAGGKLAVRLVRDREPRVRAAAALALVRCTGAADRRLLVAVIERGPWREAVAALDAVHGRDLRAQDLVAAARAHPDIRVRWAAGRLVMRAQRFDILLRN